MTELHFDAAERAAIVAEWKRFAAEPPPANPRHYGCATFLVAGALLLVLPKSLEMMGPGLPQLLATVARWVLGLVLTGGFVVGVFFGSGVYARAVERARDALDRLGADSGSLDPPLKRRDAVAIIYYAFVSDGPTMSSTVDEAAAREKLGASLGYVMAVERVLVEELGAWRLLTREERPSARE